jgi:hypothetical protein
MVSIFATSVVDRGFKYASGMNQDNLSD